MELKERTNGEKAAYLEGYVAALQVTLAGLLRVAQATDFTVTQLQSQVNVLLALAAADKDA